MGGKTSMMLRDDEVKRMSEETGFTKSQIEKLFSRFSLLDRNNCGTLGREEFMSIPELSVNPLCDRLIHIFLKNGDSGSERIDFKQFMSVLAIFGSCNHSGSKTINIFEGHARLLEIGLKPPSTPMTLTNTSTLTNLESGQRIAVLGKHLDSDTGRTNRIPDIDKGSSRTFESLINDVSNPAQESLRSKLAFIFKIYDVDCDGKISFNDLRSILRLMVGNYIEDVQLDKIATRAFVEVDEDSDGYIEFKEFCDVLSGRDLDDKLRVKFFN